jgi:hypothetical protein
MPLIIAAVECQGTVNASRSTVLIRDATHLRQSRCALWTFRMKYTTALHKNVTVLVENLLEIKRKITPFQFSPFVSFL